jgi:oxygen-dependent protoporphyrinogen oxidase
METVPMKTVPMPSALVVGGGMAGLVAARDLAAGGMSVVLLEAGDRLGGKVCRHTVAGIELDAGAESFANRRGIVAGLAAELDLTVVAPLAEGAWLKPASGNPVHLPHTSFLGIPGTPLARDVIAVIGRRAALRAELDSVMPGLVGSKDPTLGGLVRKRMGSEVLERLVAPIVMGIHSRHPDDLEVDVVAPGLRAALIAGGSLAQAVRSLRAASPAGSAVSGVQGGMAMFVERLQRDLERNGGTVRLGAGVTTVDRHGVLLGSGERLEADHVVLATPLGAASDSTIVLATLVVDDGALDGAPRGTGLLVAAGARGISAKALTHATAKWSWLAAELPPHRHVVRLSYNAPAPDGLEERARLDAEALLGVSIPIESVIGFDVVEWPAVPPRPQPVEGVTMVGESVSGTGLAAVISHARREAGRLLGEVES